MREIEPSHITQGERAEWTRTFGDYPATEWTIQYRFRGPGTGFDVDAAASGSDHLAEISSASSEAAEPGRYHWQAWATSIEDATDIRVIDAGETVVKRGFAESNTEDIDLRSPAKRMLDLIDAAMAASGGSDIIEYEVTTPAGARRVKRSTRGEMISQRKYYAATVAKEMAAAITKRTGKIGRIYGVRTRER